MKTSPTAASNDGVAELLSLVIDLAMMKSSPRAVSDGEVAENAQRIDAVHENAQRNDAMTLISAMMQLMHADIERIRAQLCGRSVNASGVGSPAASTSER